MATRRRKKAAAGSTGLAADEVTAEQPPAEIEALAAEVEEDGGTALASYREPYGGRWVILASLPLDRIEATPFQRELSEAHAKRLADVIPKVGRFLDPVVAIKANGGYWTPNGLHRLAAMRQLGAKAIMALLVPDHEVAYRILALNTEKAHNLKDRSLEAIRMLRSLAAAPDTAKLPESDWAFEFEEPAYLTLGVCYEERPRFAGSSYLPILKRVESFTGHAIGLALSERQDQAARVLELDDAVNDVVEQLRERGFRSAYLKPFVVARINPLRFARATKPGQKAPRADFEETLDKMIAAAERFDASRIRPEQVAVMGGAVMED